MALLDPVSDNAALSIFVLGLYASNVVLAHPSIGADFYELRPGFFLWTTLLITAYTAYNLLSGSTFDLWGTVTRVVVVLSLFAFVATFGGGGMYSTELDFLSWQTTAVLLAPVALYLSFKCVRFAHLLWGEHEDGGVSY